MLPHTALCYGSTAVVSVAQCTQCRGRGVAGSLYGGEKILDKTDVVRLCLVWDEVMLLDG